MGNGELLTLCRIETLHLVTPKISAVDCVHFGRTSRMVELLAVSNNVKSLCECVKVNRRIQRWARGGRGRPPLSLLSTNSKFLARFADTERVTVLYVCIQWLSFHLSLTLLEYSHLMSIIGLRHRRWRRDLRSLLMTPSDSWTALIPMAPPFKIYVSATVGPMYFCIVLSLFARTTRKEGQN